MKGTFTGRNGKGMAMQKKEVIKRKINFESANFRTLLLFAKAANGKRRYFKNKTEF
ncbi:MAG: hypothetical protein WKG06_44385 [Segetibacter sp.]